MMWYRMKQVVHIAPRFTNRSTDQLDIFLSDITKYSLLTAEEEFALCEKIKQGDEQAVEELCNKNMRFVVSVAKQFQDYWVPLADLINEGSIGLKKAARRFDHTKWFRFISYAVRWIKQGIQSAISDQAKTIKTPHNKLWAINKLKKHTSKLEQQLGRLPTQEELALALDWKIDEVQDLQILSNTSLTLLDNYTDDSDTHTLIDNFSLGDENNIETNIQQEANAYTAHQLLTTLHSDAQTMLKMRYGITPYTHEYTESEIAEKFDLPITTVRYKINQAILAMKRRTEPKHTPPKHTEPKRTKTKRTKDYLPPSAKAQRVSIVQMKYGISPYTHKHTEYEIGQKLHISRDNIINILNNAPSYMIHYAQDINILSTLVLSLDEEQQKAVRMKYGIYPDATPRTDIEIAHQMQITLVHVRSLLTNFNILLRKAVFANQISQNLSS